MYKTPGFCKPSSLHLNRESPADIMKLLIVLAACAAAALASREAELAACVGFGIEGYTVVVPRDPADTYYTNRCNYICANLNFAEYAPANGNYDNNSRKATGELKAYPNIQGGPVLHRYPCTHNSGNCNSQFSNRCCCSFDNPPQSG